MAIGVPYNTFKHLNPTKLKPFFEAHKIKQRMRDEEAWFMWGNYGFSAFNTIISHFGAGLVGKHSDVKYIEKPIMHTESEDNGYRESQEEIAVFEMKQRTRLLAKQGLPESPK